MDLAQAILRSWERCDYKNIEPFARERQRSLDPDSAEYQRLDALIREVESGREPLFWSPQSAEQCPAGWLIRWNDRRAFTGNPQDILQYMPEGQYLYLFIRDDGTAYSFPFGIDQEDIFQAVLADLRAGRTAPFGRLQRLSGSPSWLAINDRPESRTSDNERG